MLLRRVITVALPVGYIVSPPYALTVVTTVCCGVVDVTERGCEE